MNGADLSRRGTWLCSLLVNTSVNFPLNSLAFSKSDWARPLPCLFFKGGNTLGIFFLTVYVTIKIPRISLPSPTKLFTYRSCCFLISALISLLKVSNLDLILALPVLLAFARVSFFLRIFRLISGVIHGTEEIERLVFEEMCLSAES